MGSLLTGVSIALAALALLAATAWLSPVDLELDYRGGFGGHRLRVRVLLLWGWLRVWGLDLALGRPAPSGVSRRLPYHPRTPVRLRPHAPSDRLLDWVARVLPRNLRRWLGWGRKARRWWRWAQRQRRRARARDWEGRVYRAARMGFFGQAQVYSRLFRHLFNRAAFRRFVWRTALGTGDPAETGWAVGSLWVIKAAVGAWAAQTLPPQAVPQLDVIADFRRRRLRTRLYCIARVRAGDIIYATFRAWREFKARRGLQVRRVEGDGGGLERESGTAGAAGTSSAAGKTGRRGAARKTGTS